MIEPEMARAEHYATSEDLLAQALQLLETPAGQNDSSWIIKYRQDKAAIYSQMAVAHALLASREAMT